MINKNVGRPMSDIHFDLRFRPKLRFAQGWYKWHAAEYTEAPGAAHYFITFRQVSTPSSTYLVAMRMCDGSVRTVDNLHPVGPDNMTCRECGRVQAQVTEKRRKT